MPHIKEDPGVDGHHYGESNQVDERPEHQETATVERRHSGALLQVAQTVPSHGGKKAHNNRHHPDGKYDDENPPLAHLAVQLHVEDGLVSLHGNSKEIEDGGREAGVD